MDDPFSRTLKGVWYCCEFISLLLRLTFSHRPYSLSPLPSVPYLSPSLTLCYCSEGNRGLYLHLTFNTHLYSSDSFLKSLFQGINILKAHGKSAKDSYLLNGYALNTGRAAQGMLTRVAPAKIACLDFNLQKTKMQMGVQVLVSDPRELEKIRQRFFSDISISLRLMVFIMCI